MSQSKKVFSIEKFKQWCKKEGKSESDINYSLHYWGYECEGKTEEEMKELSFDTMDDWMVEVESTTNKEVFGE